MASAVTPETWERAFDSIQDPIAIADADGVVRQVNRSFRRRFATDPEELSGARIETLLYGRNGLPHEDLHAAHVSYETSALRAPGTFLVSQTPIELEDGVGLLYHLTDLGALRAAEAAARESEARARQGQKMEALGRLAGGVAHDFNNLLTAVLCNAEVLRERLPARPDAAEPLDQILYAAGRGAALVRHLLSFSRPRPGQPELLDIDERIADLARFLTTLLGEDVRLDLRLESPRYRVRIDPVHLEQVLLNLAINARDAMGGRGTLTIATRSAKEPGGSSCLTLDVTDTGSGMDEKTRSCAFEPFFTTKPEGQGTGLGLATVYAIVQQAGGEISLESEPGRGTTVRLRLPAALHPESTPPPPERVSAPLRRGPGGLVLLVEDEDAPRKAIGEVLRELGYQVLATADARDALDLARRHEGKIDLLLADVVMPGKSGAELARDIRQAYPSTRILLMSGYGSDARRERLGGAAQGDLPLLIKPFSVNDLAARLDQLIGSSRPPRP